MVTCYDCRGDGYTVFLNNESTCMTCHGAGELKACNTFTRDPKKVVVFRNQPCFNCGVRENNHRLMEVTT
jgi:DnaJ-class molecular chaperone